MSIIGEIWEEKYYKLKEQLKSNIKVMEEALEAIKLLEAKILEFRDKINHPQAELITTNLGNLLKIYDKHFDLKIKK